MKEGEEFENLTEAIFKKLAQNSPFDSVQKNIRLNGKDGPRQIDVLLTTKTCGLVLKTIIECKDYRGKIPIGKVDELHSKIQDLNANKGILVSSVGFSSKAISKAKRLGIDLFTAHEALSSKWNISIDVPILITEVRPIKIVPSGIISPKFDVRFKNDAINLINDLNLSEELHLLWRTGKIKHELTEKDQPLVIEVLKPPYFIRDIDNNKIELHDFELSIVLEINYYYGFLNQQKNTQLLDNIIEGTKTIFFDSNLLLNYPNAFKKILQSQIPNSDTLKLEVRAYPDFKITPAGMGIEKIR